MLIAAALVIPVIIIEESHPGEPLDTVGSVLNYAIWIAFLIEVVVMLSVVPNRKLWLRSHPVEVVVVLLTPPFLLAALAPVRALRLLRLLRLLQLAPLVRRLFTAEGVKYTGLLALLTALAAGETFHSVEDKTSLAEGVYLALTTMTTVGFSGPETETGKVVAVVVMLIGIGFVAILTGAVAERFLGPRVEKIEATERQIERGEEDLIKRVRRLSVELMEVEQVLSQRLSERPAQD